jgi:ABC-2 type transport system permease protein
MAVWKAAAAASKNPGQIAGMTTGEMMAYFLMTMIVGHLVTAWDIYEMGWKVRTGRMSPELLRPILPIWESLCDNLAYKLVTLVILVPIWFVIGLAVRPTFHTAPGDLALGAAAVVLAGLLSFVWGYACGCIAFFVTKMDAVAEMYFGASMFFGGRIAPIEFLPASLQWIAAALPFRWIVAFPSQLLAGQVSGRAAWFGIGAQLAWLAAGVVVFRIVWSRGIRRYSAVGA